MLLVEAGDAGLTGVVGNRVFGGGGAVCSVASTGWQSRLPVPNGQNIVAVQGRCLPAASGLLEKV
jgi:hypothetical protein